MAPLFEVFRPVLVFSEMFTMTPFKMLNGDNQKNPPLFAEHRKGPFYCIRMMILTTFVVACVFYIQRLRSIYDVSSVIAISVQFSHYNFRIPGTLLCILLVNFYSRKIVEFLQEVAKIDEELEEVGVVVSYANAKRLAKLSMASIFFQQLVQQLPYFFEGFHQDLASVLDFVISNIPILLIQILILHWMLYQNILAQHFEALNKILKTLKHRHCWVVEDLLPQSDAREPFTTVSTLKFCGILYNKLCLQAKKVNQAFAWQILFLIPSFFLVIIYSSFITCQMIKAKHNFDIKVIVFNLAYFVAFLEFVMPCVKTKDEADKFRDVLHKVDVNFERDGEIDSVMNALTLQTYHQRVEFTAHGVFPLDGTLIYSIFGALTTYLVILLQFDV